MGQYLSPRSQRPRWECRLMVYTPKLELGSERKLQDNLTDSQRKTKINNLINELSNKLKKICNQGSNTKPKWVLCEDFKL